MMILFVDIKIFFWKKYSEKTDFKIIISTDNYENSCF